MSTYQIIEQTNKVLHVRVLSPTIRGEHWEIRHAAGRTAATIVGFDYDDPNEEIVVERADTPEWFKHYDVNSHPEAMIQSVHWNLINP